MKKMPLTQGKFALVDDADYEDLAKHKWYAYRNAKTFYATREIRINKKRHSESMHRRILGLELGDKKEVDHINGDGLDNRRGNLRVCTHQQNIQNRMINPSNNTSGYKGVSQHRGKWQVLITVDSKRKYIGIFYSPLVAALAYNQAALKYFGEFARLNQVEGME